jgi:WhiB family transcriptional regulator, redox-sensing transcriptional regulator
MAKIHAEADLTWKDQAACRDLHPDLFFPIGTTGEAVEHIQDAKAVCAECPVAQACLYFALETHQEYGIWGGTTEDERRAIRRLWLTTGRPQDVTAYLAHRRG